MLEQAVPEGLILLKKMTCIGELLPMSWSHTGEVNEVSRGRDPMLEQQQEQHQCDELTITPVPISLCCWVGGRR